MITWINFLNLRKVKLLSLKEILKNNFSILKDKLVAILVGKNEDHPDDTFRQLAAENPNPEISPVPSDVSDYSKVSDSIGNSDQDNQMEIQHYSRK